eukprot:CAMPEP_0184496578 /NCGR_PEP_ID=MMETSP0113_2-20130426/34316_1 /TAXON_ID=91329 /ORGANISM="Norrisiella sphaerica, Strain BC52" /LENGTH=75 /DNA_ID=CAMNT_0026883259 /DNA_START=1646 /DNA_END=1870 /DNA_ORIENTATION=+
MVLKLSYLHIHSSSTLNFGRFWRKNQFEIDRGDTERKEPNGEQYANLAQRMLRISCDDALLVVENGQLVKPINSD